MRNGLRYTVAGLALATSLVSCASTPARSGTPVAAASVSKPGFYTEIRDGRLWVFREGSKELADFKQHGEPAHQVTRIGGGPNGMTIKSHDAVVINEYLAAK
jgi:hypothetical protein